MMALTSVMHEEAVCVDKLLHVLVYTHRHNTDEPIQLIASATHILKAILGLSYIEGNSDIFKNKGTSFWNVVPNSGFYKNYMHSDYCNCY